jgi:pilus assembly protein CpaB
MVFVVLAGLAAMLAAVVVYSALKRRERAIQEAVAQNVQVVVAAYDLPLGTKIEQAELKMTRWSADSLPEGAYRDSHQIVGSYVKSSFVANEPIVASKLFLGEKTAGVMPLLIPFGMRAVSVQVDEVSDIAGFVLPHARVDVLVAITGAGAEGKAFSKVVLQNVEVLAIAQEVEKKKDEPTPVKVVTLLVTPQEAERLALASREGTLRLAMRNYSDNKIVLTSGTDVEQMLRSYSLAPQVPIAPSQPTMHQAAMPAAVLPYEVEILRNGKTAESVSFVNEPAAQKKRRAAHAPDDAAASSADAGASAAAPPRPETGSDKPAEPSDGANKPAAAAAGATDVGNAPTPRTIDIP